MKRLLGGIITAAIFSGCTGTPPSNLGADAGRLAPCPDSPNCVSSQAEGDHFIEPFTYEGAVDDARAALRAIVEADRSLRLIEHDEQYLRVEARTRIMRFVDDLEFYFPDDESIVHVRSASRLGYSDMGVNRKRMEAIRELFEERLAAR